MSLGTTGDHGFITFSVKIVTDCSCLGTLKDPMKNTCKSLVTFSHTLVLYLNLEGD